MTLIALELSDAGIMAAAGTPARLIPVDGTSLASPGYILPVKKKLSVGKSAESQAHRFPRQIHHRFWDQLSTLPLKPRERWAGNYAEMALKHLAEIWRHLKTHGRSLVITLPGYYTREQMGLVLGIARDLKIDVVGLVNQAIATAPHPVATGHLLYADIHLHRTEVSLLGQGDRLQHQQTLTLDTGLIGVHRHWIDTIAEVFVSATRYDPLHTAASEQGLYDRLPGVLDDLAQNATTSVEARTDHTVHRISLPRETLVGRAEGFYEQVCGLIRNLMEKDESEPAGVTLLLSHRMGQLPGLADGLRSRLDANILTLAPGASATNVLAIWDQLERPAGIEGAFYFKQRPWARVPAPEAPIQTDPPDPVLTPTHLLCGHIAHPLTESPLAVIQHNTGQMNQLAIVPRDQARDDILFIVCLAEGHAVLSVEGTREITVDGQRATGRVPLALGQTICTANGEDTVRLITCL
jgi:hypothetical protein